MKFKIEIHQDILKTAILRGMAFEHKAYPAFKNFIEFLELNKIIYFLATGTLLGAVRDAGKVLWDDDYDIFIDSEEIKKLEKFPPSQKEVKLLLTFFRNGVEKGIDYVFSHNGFNYAITSNKYNYHKVWCLNDFKAPMFKVMDVFCADYDIYRSSPIKHQLPVLKKQFNDILCNVASNYEDELNHFYGTDYMERYVVCNHGIDSRYKVSETDKYITLNKEELDDFLRNVDLTSLLT